MKNTQKLSIFYFAPFSAARSNTNITTELRYIVDSSHCTGLWAKPKDAEHVMTQI
jgi:hypothetical protein